MPNCCGTPRDPHGLLILHAIAITEKAHLQGRAAYFHCQISLGAQIIPAPMSHTWL